MKTLAIALVGLLMPLAAMGQTADWVQQAINSQAELNGGTGLGGKLTPGKVRVQPPSDTMLVCIDGQPYAVTVTKNPDGSNFIRKQPATGGDIDCSESVDQNDDPLPSPNSIAVGGCPCRRPVRALPIYPVYDVSLLTQEPSCDPRCFAYVVNHTNGTVTRISPCNAQIAATIPVTSRPLQVALTPDQSTAVVTSFDNAITFIDTGTNAVSSSFITDPSINPSGLAITPDGTRAYVTSFNNFNPEVVVMDLKQRMIVSMIPVDDYPHSVFVTPDGSQAWVTHPFGGIVNIIDTLTNTVSQRLAAPGALGVAFNPTGTQAYIASTQGMVQVLDTKTYNTLATIPADFGASEMVVTEDGYNVWVNNNLGGSFTIFDTRTFASDTMALGGHPRGLMCLHDKRP